MHKTDLFLLFIDNSYTNGYGLPKYFTFPPNSSNTFAIEPAQYSVMSPLLTIKSGFVQTISLSFNGNKKLIPPTQKDFSQEVRDKFINATTYLNVKGEPCDASDFFRIFVGIDDIHPIYRNAGLEITDEHAKNTTEYVRNIFLGYCQEEMLSRKEAWNIVEPELQKIMKQKKQQNHFKNILSGLEEWSQPELAAYTKNGTISVCPLNEMWSKITKKSMPECRDVWTKGHKVKYSELKPIS